MRNISLCRRVPSSFGFETSSIAEHFNGTHSTCTTSTVQCTMLCVCNRTNKQQGARCSTLIRNNSKFTECVAVVYKRHRVQTAFSEMYFCSSASSCLFAFYLFFFARILLSPLHSFSSFRRRVDGCVCVCIQLFGVYCQQRYCAVCSIQNY